MKHWLAALTLFASLSAMASEATANLAAICHNGVGTDAAEVRELMQASVADIFRVTKDSEERGIHKFGALRFAVNECQSEVAAPVVNELMTSIEPVFHICNRSTPRCISALANVLYRFENHEI